MKAPLIQIVGGQSSYVAAYYTVLHVNIWSMPVILTSIVEDVAKIKIYSNLINSWNQWYDQSKCNGKLRVHVCTTLSHAL